MDWFKGKSTGNHRFSHEIWGVPVNFPLNQSIDWLGTQHLPMISPEGRHAMRGWRHAPCAVGAMRHAPGVPGTACLWFFVNPITEDVPTLGPIYIYKWHIIWWYIYILLLLLLYMYIYIIYLQVELLAHLLQYENWHTSNTKGSGTLKFMIPLNPLLHRHFPYINSSHVWLPEGIPS